MSGVADLSRLLDATEFLDYDSPEVREFVARAVPDPEAPAREKAVQLYYAVRDGVFYEVFGADLSREGLRASSVVRRNMGFCAHKSILYAAAVRSVGIPSRLVLAEVRNHLASPRLKELVGGEVFLHWFTTIHLGGRWLKVTPVFNRMLCRLYRMRPLEFDGTSDSLYHPFDESGRRHMEFLRWHGEYDDVDYDLLIGKMRSLHPGMFREGTTVPAGSLVEQAPGH
ncbi:MAG TPA: transglutaminase-like domain-containing protein [Pseudonocardiaceae bacterium]